MHLLWKYDRKACDGPDCIRCSLRGRAAAAGLAVHRGDRRGLAPARRPDLPQPPRAGGASAAGDRRRPLVHLPYFLPDDWSAGIEDEEPRAAPSGPTWPRRAGWCAMKGFQRLIPMMRLPARGRPADRRDRAVRGRAPRPGRATCRTSISRGCWAGRRWPGCSTGARAVVVPSLFPETFGYVVLEAFAVGTPVVVHEGGGALRRPASLSGGGLGYRDRRRAAPGHAPDRPRRRPARRAGRTAASRQRIGEWSETAHLDRYFELIQAGAARPGAYRPVSSAPTWSRRGVRRRAARPWRTSGARRPDAAPGRRRPTPVLVLIALAPGLLRAAGRRADRH